MESSPLAIPTLQSKNESHSVMSDCLRPYGLYRSWNSPGQNPGVGSLSLLQGIFPTQGWNPGLPLAGGFFTNWAIRESPKWIHFFTIDEPTLTQPSHTKSIVYITVHYVMLHILWVWTRASVSIIISSVRFSHSVVSDSLWSHRLQHARPPCPSPTSRVYSNSCP